MDPNATLNDIKQNLHNWYNHGDEDALRDLADSTDALLEWIDKGGYLPEKWKSIKS